MPQPIVLDLETQFKFQEVGYDVKKLKISVVGIYNYANNNYLTYREDELPQLFNLLEHASFIIGFNIRKFDMMVLSSYYHGNTSQFQLLDILEEVEKSLGHRLALDDLVRASLGFKKSGHGLLAIEHFREGRWDELCKYCLSDVKATKELYEFGLKNKKLFFQTHHGKREIKISFERNKKEATAVSLSLPF